jgi:hypothetical protein
LFRFICFVYVVVFVLFYVSFLIVACFRFPLFVFCYLFVLFFRFSLFLLFLLFWASARRRRELSLNCLKRDNEGQRPSQLHQCARSGLKQKSADPSGRACGGFPSIFFLKMTPAQDPKQAQNTKISKMLKI